MEPLTIIFSENGFDCRKADPQGFLLIYLNKKFDIVSIPQFQKQCAVKIFLEIIAPEVLTSHKSFAKNRKKLPTGVGNIGCLIAVKNSHVISFFRF